MSNAVWCARHGCRHGPLSLRDRVGVCARCECQAYLVTNDCDGTPVRRVVLAMLGGGYTECRCGGYTPIRIEEAGYL